MDHLTEQDNPKNEEATMMNTTTDNNNQDAHNDPEDNDNDLTNESSSLIMISSHVPIPRVRPWGQQMHPDNTNRQSPSSAPKRLSVHQRRSVRKSLKSSLHNSGSDHRSLFSSMSSMASAGSTSGIFDLEEDEDDNDNDTTNTPTNKRGTLARQESWYQDLVAQGMTDADIAALLGGEDEADEEEQNDMTPVNAITQNTEARAPVGDNIPTNTLDEQTTASQAQALAKQQVLERLGYDPWERASNAQHDFAQTQNNTFSSSSTSSWRFPPTRTVLPRPPPPPSQPSELFTWNPQPWIDNEPNMTTTTTLDLVVGEAIATKDDDHPNTISSMIMDSHNKIPVICWGCGQAHAVPIMATLMRCPQCQTVSPASSSTTTKSTIPRQT